MKIDDVLKQIQANLGLEAETEHDLREEIRGHLKDAVTEAQARGMDAQSALVEAAKAFGIDQTSNELRVMHASREVWEGIAAAALPVLFALVLGVVLDYSCHIADNHIPMAWKWIAATVGGFVAFPILVSISTSRRSSSGILP